MERLDRSKNAKAATESATDSTTANGPVELSSSAHSPSEVDIFSIDLSTELETATSAGAVPVDAFDLPPDLVQVIDDNTDPFAEPVAAPSDMVRATAVAKPADKSPSAALAITVPATAIAPSTAAASVEVEQSDSGVLPLASGFNSGLVTALPSWAISMLVHVGVLVLLAMFSIDEIRTVISILQASSSATAETLQTFDLQGPADALEAPTSEEPLSEPAQAEVALPEVTPSALEPTANSLETPSLTALSESVLPSALLSSSMNRLTSTLNGRSAAMKSEMLERYGGNAASEKSVAMGLKWIAEHQAPNGAWSFAHSRFCKGQCKDDGTKLEAVNGATAMALLPFLGAGQTHLQGQYKNTVKKGLAFLIDNIKVTPGTLPYGSWNEPGGTMYSHGLAAITICEAYAMTRDPGLLQPAQLSLNYLVYAQDSRGGGWRYSPHQPGDTSVVGWCLMALKSGAMGNLTVPQSSFRGASQFLDSVSTNNGAYYGYDRPTAKTDGRQATIAVGLLCRMYLGWTKENEAIQEGIDFLAKRGPSGADLYYSYYGTQVMRHYGGPEWERWNNKMRDDLIKSQVSEGHAAGSWYAPGGHGKEGGRLYATSLATMILEVYYRHLPLYSEKSSADDFEL